jgi:hypothetical protein
MWCDGWMLTEAVQFEHGSPATVQRRKKSVQFVKLNARQSGPVASDLGAAHARTAVSGSDIVHTATVKSGSNKPKNAFSALVIDNDPEDD